MNIINGNKIGTRVNVFINGTLHSKDFGTDRKAKEFFNLIIEVKGNPTDENLEKLFESLNENVRIAKIAGFEYDVDTDETFMEGFNTPVPEDIINTMEDYIDNGYPIESIQNFWKLLMANPDKRVREDLFLFIKTHDFSLTDQGYMIVYKTVDFLRKVEKDLASFASDSYIKIRDKWKEAPTNYVVYKEFNREIVGGYEDVVVEEGYEDEYGDWIDEVTENQWVEHEVVTFDYKVTKTTTFEKWEQEAKKEIEPVENLQVLMDTLAEIEEENRSVFTDKYSKSMEIKLGVPVKMDRAECDADPKQSCSYGLHVGATSYVEQFRGAYRTNADHDRSPVLVCLVNPMHVVAVPDYDHSKMRVSEYYPFARGTVNAEAKIDIVEQSYFENDYTAHEEEELNAMLEANMDNVRKTSINAEEDNRSDEEYLKVLQSRVVDLTA